MVRIFSLVDSIVSMAFSNGDKVVWREEQRVGRAEGGVWVKEHKHTHPHAHAHKHLHVSCL